MEKGGTFNCFGPGSKPGGCRILGFFSSKKNPKNRRKIADFTEKFPKFHQIDYRWRISCRPPPINEKSAIFRRHLAKFCSLAATWGVGNPCRGVALRRIMGFPHHEKVGVPKWHPSGTPRRSFAMPQQSAAPPRRSYCS